MSAADPRQEREVLAACVISGAYHLAAPYIREDTWSVDAHRRIWAAMSRLVAAGQPLDLATIRAELADAGDLERIGGLDGLRAVTEMDGYSGHAETYARRLADLARARAVADACRAVAAEEEHGLVDPGEYAARSAQVIATAATSGAMSPARPIAEVARETYQAILDGRGVVASIQTGIAPVDAALGGGIPAGRMTCVVGRPGMGKTALALGMVAGMCRAGRRVLVLSLEMSVREVSSRIAGITHGLPISNLIDGRVPPGRDADLTAAIEEQALWALHVHDTPGLTAAQCIGIAETIRAQHRGLDAVVIDHLHLMRHPGGSRTRTDLAMAETSGQLRDAAKRGGWALVLCAQLNRSSERDNRPPRMSDIREAGAIEQDAYAIIAPWRTLEPGPADDPGEAWCGVLKHRSGRVGRTPMRWHGEWARYD